MHLGNINPKMHTYRKKDAFSPRYNASKNKYIGKIAHKNGDIVQGELQVEDTFKISVQTEKPTRS